MKTAFKENSVFFGGKNNIILVWKKMRVNTNWNNVLFGWSAFKKPCLLQKLRCTKSQLIICSTSHSSLLWLYMLSRAWSMTERERTRRLIFISIDPHCCAFQAEGKRKPVLIWSCWWGDSLPLKRHITRSLFVPSAVTFRAKYMHMYTLRWISWHKEVFQVTNQKKMSLYLPTEKPLLF